jgi:Zn-dependent protease with chaperone function
MSTLDFELRGTFLDGRLSTAHAAVLRIDAAGIAHLNADEFSTDLPLDSLSFSERLGNVPRRCRLPGGELFETADNDAVDAALRAHGRAPRGSFVDSLERRWPFALLALVLIAILSVGFVRYGLPAAAAKAAEVTPVAVDRALGQQTLELLDKVLLTDSELGDARRAELATRFSDMVRDLDDGHRYELVLRHSERIGANAFALPSGTVVMTDELVELAKSDDEIVAVLAHEIGHVRGRHALRQLLQASGVAAIATTLLGDVSQLTAVAGAAPALLQAKNSRDMEREADSYAKVWLDAHGIPEHSFDDILCRMDASHKGRSRSALNSFFATHPATRERANCEAKPPA